MVLILKDADDIKIALNSPDSFEKAQIFYKPYFEHAMLTIGGNKYKLRRKTISPLFFPASLKSFLPVFNSQMKSFLERFDARLESKAIDFSHCAINFTFDTILVTMFGMNDIDEGIKEKFVHDYDQ